MDEQETHGGGDDDHGEKVRRRAHAIWLDEGMAHGRDQEHWHQAEQEISAEEAERASPNATDPIPSPVKGSDEPSPKSAVGQSGRANYPEGSEAVIEVVPLASLTATDSTQD